MGYPLGMIGAVADNRFFKEYFEYPSDDDIESLAAVMFSTAALGCLIFGETADALGRRWCNISIATLLTVGAALQALPLFVSTHLRVIYLGRGIMGIAFGGLNSSLSVYIGETASLSLRGFLEAYLDCMSFVGTFAGYIICYVMLPDHNRGWVYCLASQMPFCLAFLAMSIKCPESPRWLMLSGDFEGAKRELIKVHGDATDSGWEDEADALVMFSKPQRTAPWTEALSFTFEWPSILAIVLIVHSNACGNDVITQFAPEIFAEGRYGLKDESEDLLCTVWCGLITVVACVIPTFGIDQFGRRIFLVTGLALCTFAFGLLAHGYTFTFNESTRSLMHVAPLFIFNTGFGVWSPCIYCQPTELLHTRVRSKVTAIAWSLAWLCDYLAVGTFLSMRTAFGDGGTFFFYFSVNAAIGAFLIYYIPETMGCELDSRVGDILDGAPSLSGSRRGGVKKTLTCYGTSDPKPSV